jgi:hypothetical protein
MQTTRGVKEEVCQRLVFGSQTSELKTLYNNRRAVTLIKEIDRHPKD